MPPHEGLVHPKEYDWRDSNVELVNSELDHQVKYKSAETEPAWNNGVVGKEAGLYIWRIEEFEVVPWPQEKYGQFHEGDSYIVLLSIKIEKKNSGGATGDEEGEGKPKFVHDIFFWLGSRTTQDEAGTAAYKTVELDEFLHGAATQHRELQSSPSNEFIALFPRLQILKGGVRSGFTHVEEEEQKPTIQTLLRIFKLPNAGRDSVVVHEVPPTWHSLSEDDVFVLDRGDKIFVWQGKSCSPMEKAKAAQVVHDLTIAKHVDVEVLAQSEARSKVIVDYLGGADEGVDPLRAEFKAQRPLQRTRQDGNERKLWKLSDESGQLNFHQIKSGKNIRKSDLDTNDVFLLDTGSAIWVWEGRAASKAERAMWIKVAQAYVRQRQEEEEVGRLGIAKVNEGNENQGFLKALEVA